MYIDAWNIKDNYRVFIFKNFKTTQLSQTVSEKRLKVSL